MRIRTALAALALAAASVAGTATTAAASNEFGDIIITTEEHTDIVSACNDALLLLSPSVQCGVFNITPQ